MPRREKTATAHISLRLKEPLRARLESDAREAGKSLNSEINRRLEQSIRDDDTGTVIIRAFEAALALLREAQAP
jgi:hypothetical protein